MAVSRFSLIRILADGSFHSGERLGRALGLSRAGVENQVRRVEALGLRIFKVRGRGYRLAEAVDLLDCDALAARLRASCPELSVEVRDECPSTSTALAGKGAPHGAVLACEHQSAGRGRRGNAWLSAPAGSLTFSLLWRFSQGAAGLAGLSLAVAVGAVRALERLGIKGVQLKWPNDLYCGERKLGGILIESSGDALGPSTVIVGLGLNVRLGSALREHIDRPVTDLASCCGEAVPRRTLLLGALLESLADVLARFAREGFAPFRDDWQRRHAWQGRRVRLALAGRRIAEGEALGVAEDGALVLSSPRGVERFHSGELSLRRA
jgi:BirA family transcriptional regulator, biotin operon repressor / biotin---[acetyl-CoA-carboxylase] ligase